MKPYEIRLGDWQRALFGDVPPEFFLEIILRTVIVFFLLIISMRLFGKRMAAQVNRIEMVALFSLAAAIGVPLQSPERGLLPAFVIALVVIVLGKLIARIAYGNEHLEARIEDKLAILANDGVLDLQKFRGTVLTRQRVFAQIRSEGIRHLGEVKRLYVEANGGFSIVREQNPTYGLSVLPPGDTDFCEEQTQCEEKVCGYCGKRQKDNAGAKRCSNCKKNRWTNGIF
jgi:uncharacterized membrane protein YcaP (DUF421 family)